MDRVMLTWIWDVLPLAVSSYSVCPPARGISPTLIQPNPALYMTVSSTLYTLVCFHIFHVLLLLPICSDSHHQCN